MKNRSKKIIIRTKRDIFNDKKANHPSIFNGDGLDFIELREYRIGDDSRFIDHLTTAKKQKPFVRVFKEERELNIVTISLLSGSTTFGTKLQKQELIANIVATIGISALSYQDSFSSAIYTNSLQNLIKPSKKLNFLQKGVENILTYSTISKSIDYQNLEDTIKKHITKRSIIFFIGDFFDIPSFKKINSFHEVIALIVRDRFEERPKEIENINLTDANTKESIDVNIDKNFISEYQKNIHLYDSLLYKSLKKDRVRFAKIYTDENPTKKLRKLFMSKR